LTSRVRDKKLALTDVQGGTFTLNNTGVLGSTVSQPIINYPQAAILTTEAIQKRPVVINDAIAIRSMMNLCMSFDHRINDGAESSTFLQAVKRRIEAIDADTPVY
jgi:2-oxoisovalerate dehydrogenase E2 component (dihydrolipoyl transacylase)